MKNTNKIEKEYKQLLNSGMFWEFFPDYTGNWDEDKDKFIKFYEERAVNKTKEETYPGVEGKTFNIVLDSRFNTNKDLLYKVDTVEKSEDGFIIKLSPFKPEDKVKGIKKIFVRF